MNDSLSRVLNQIKHFYKEVFEKVRTRQEGIAEYEIQDMTEVKQLLETGIVWS